MKKYTVLATIVVEVETTIVAASLEDAEARVKSWNDLDNWEKQDTRYPEDIVALEAK